MSRVVEGVWSEVSKSHFVHQESVDDAKRSEREGFLAYTANTLEKAREQTQRECFVEPDFVPFTGSIEEIQVPAPNLKEPIPTTVYKPEPRPGDEPQTIMVYFHGGGLVICDRTCYMAQSRQLAMRTGAIIVLPGYRLLPIPGDEFAPFDDCLAVTKWVLANKEAVGGRKDSKVGVAGDSAGGQITSSVTHSTKGEGLSFQILVYPVAGMHCDTPSFNEFYSTPCFNGAAMVKMFKDANYDNDQIRYNPRANPAARTADDLATCPPSLVLLTPLDPLADWGLEFAEKLKAAGVKTELAIVKGVPHSFFTRVKQFPTTSLEAHDHVARFLKSLK